MIEAVTGGSLTNWKNRKAKTFDIFDRDLLASYVFGPCTFVGACSSEMMYFSDDGLSWIIIYEWQSDYHLTYFSTVSMIFYHWPWYIPPHNVLIQIPSIEMGDVPARFDGIGIFIQKKTSTLNAIFYAITDWWFGTLGLFFHKQLGMS